MLPVSMSDISGMPSTVRCTLASGILDCWCSVIVISFTDSVPLCAPWESGLSILKNGGILLLGPHHSGHHLAHSGHHLVHSGHHLPLVAFC